MRKWTQFWLYVAGACIGIATPALGCRVAILLYDPNRGLQPVPSSGGLVFALFLMGGGYMAITCGLGAVRAIRPQEPYWRFTP